MIENVSANGVIGFLDPWFGPGEDGDNADQLAALMEQSAAEDALTALVRELKVTTELPAAAAPSG